MREWAEQCVVIPEGRFKGRRLNVNRVPWTGLFFDAVDSGRYRMIVSTGCVQGGKTLITFDVPLAYHLCEWGETVIGGVPNMRTASDKWRTEIKPIFAASHELARYLPTEGRGSKGGQFTAIRFSNQAELNFMGGGGGDEARSHYTARVACVTEANRLMDIGESSEEAAPIYQILNRLESYGGDGVFYAECTTGTSKGFTEVYRLAGTASMIVKPCPHCSEWVSPEREHFVGIDKCTSATDARLLCSFICPECRTPITNEQRIEMCRQNKLLHKGQTITKAGVIEGAHPDTNVLGFRFSAFDNLLWSTQYIAERTYQYATSVDQMNAEKNARQMIWVQPFDEEQLLFEVAPLSVENVVDRQDADLPRGVCPEWATIITGAADVRDTQIHFVLFAHDGRGRCHLVNFGSLPTFRERYGAMKGIRLGLVTLRDEIIAKGVKTATGRTLRIGWFPVDSNYKTDIVRAFVRESKAKGFKNFLTSFGRGAAATKAKSPYSHPTAENDKVPLVGDQYFLKWHEKHRVHAMFVNADYWKTQTRERFATPLDQPGAITVWDAVTESERRDLIQFANQLCAEQPIEKVVPNRGPVIVWQNATGRQNHYFDVSYNALAAGHLQGARIIEEGRPASTPTKSGPLLDMF